MTIWVCKYLKIPVIASYHTHIPHYADVHFPYVIAETFKAIIWFLLKFGHNRIDATLVTSEQIKEQFDAKGIRQVDVWRKGVDTEKFNPKFKSAAMREELTDGHPEDICLLYVGRLSEEK